MYNPEDDRYKHLEGKNAVTPFFGKVVTDKSRIRRCYGQKALA